MTNNLVEIKNLEVIYEFKKNIFGNPQIIHGVNGVTLDIKKGEILAIAGESGCGKSTLAKAIMKLISSKSGEILLEDKNILKITGREELKDFYKKFK